MRKPSTAVHTALSAIWTTILLGEVIAACFITNCPPGGKRSTLPPQTKDIMPPRLKGMARQCARCGPGLVGRCYGPRICCEPHLGCLVGSSVEPLESALLPCLAESLYPAPCRNRAPACGNKGAGLCATHGLCCYQDSCHVDVTCYGRNKDSTIDKETFNFDPSYIDIHRLDDDDNNNNYYNKK